MLCLGFRITINNIIFLWRFIYDSKNKYGSNDIEPTIIGEIVNKFWSILVLRFELYRVSTFRPSCKSTWRMWLNEKFSWWDVVDWGRNVKCLCPERLLKMLWIRKDLHRLRMHFMGLLIGKINGSCVFRKMMQW